MTEEILSELLEAAGYGPLVVDGQDWVFHKLALPALHKQLRIGYAPWPPYLKTSPMGVEGIYALWTQRIATLAGFEVVWVPLNWRQLISSLHNREVDLVAPIMKVPARTFELLFSTSLPNAEIGVCGVVSRQNGSGSRIHNDQSYVLSFVEGEVGHIVGQIVFPKASIDKQPPFITVDSAVDFIRSNPRGVSDQAIRCLVVDQATAETLSNRFSDLSIVLGTPVQFPVAFAADPREEKLITLIDECIGTLKEINYCPEWVTERVL
jgi:hypothetical protein